MKILFAEDTEDLNRVVTAMLEHAGYSVDPVFDGQQALDALERSGYDIIILDIMMPKVDGIGVLKSMRARNILTPVMLLTAKAEIDDRVEGLDAGADDYLPKPFAMKELLARVNAMGRRTAYHSQTLSYANFSLDGETLSLSAENSVRLSIKEYELLSFFAQNPEKGLSTESILEHVWGAEKESADADTVHLYINYLRRKLSGVGARSGIEGEHGGSYILKEC